MNFSFKLFLEKWPDGRNWSPNDVFVFGRPSKCIMAWADVMM